MECREQKKKKRKRRHDLLQQQHQAIVTAPASGEEQSSNAARKRKKRRFSSGRGALEQYIPHVGVDTINSNWQKLQAALRKHRGAGGKQYNGSLYNPNNGSGTLEEKCGNGLGQRSINALSPKNGDSSLTKVLAMDCEMVGAGLDGKRSILARVSLVNVWGNVIYDKHVKPLEKVTDFRTKVSGIRASHLKEAESFAVVQKEVADLIMGRILVGHSVRNDLKILYLSHPKRDTRDTATYPPLQSMNGRPRALRDIALELLHVQIQAGEHCSVEDARAAMYIYQHVKREWEVSMSKRCQAGSK